MRKDFIDEEDKFSEGQDHSIDGFVTEAVKSGGNHVMRVSWLK
jgi:hypothetical protein